MTTTSTCNFTIYRKPASAAALFDDLAPVGRVQEELAMAVVDASRRMHMWTVSIEWLTMHMFGRPRLPGDPPSTPGQLDDAAREAGVDVDFLETQIAEGGLHMLGKLLVVADRGYRQAQKAQSDALAAWHRELDRVMRAAMLADRRAHAERREVERNAKAARRTERVVPAPTDAPTPVIEAADAGASSTAPTKSPKAAAKQADSSRRADVRTEPPTSPSDARTGDGRGAA